MSIAGSLIESPEPSSLGQVCRMIFVDATDHYAVVEDGPVVGVGSGREAGGAKGEGHSNLISCIWEAIEEALAPPELGF